MTIATRAMTLEQFLHLPEKEPPLEYEDGEVTQKVSPKLRHSLLQSELAAIIRELVRRSGSAIAFTEARSTFGGRSVVPDVSVYRRERLPVDDHGDVADDIFLPPDLIVEILSPKQSVTRVHRRCLWYVDNGVAIALLVDPDDRSVLVFRPNQPTRALRGDDRIDLDDLLPGFRLIVKELFDSLRVR